MNDPNTSSPILVCDVDGVVVDLSYQWWEWLVSQSDFVDDTIPTFEETNVHYDYSIPFEGIVAKDAAYHFWKMEHLYDEAMPVEGSHSLSKWNFLKRNFSFDGFMATREKHFLRANIVIDDRADNLLKFPSDVFCVLMDAPHNKDVDTEALGLYRLHSLNEDTAKFLMKYWWKFYAK